MTGFAARVSAAGMADVSAEAGLHKATAAIPEETDSMLAREHIVAAARSWLGTPYHHQASLKGAGCDCLGLVRGVYRELCGAEPEPVPPYTPDWAEAEGLETLLEGLSRHFWRRPASEALPGDVLVFRLRKGAAAKHISLMSAADRMIHAIETAPVSEVSYGPWWRRRAVAAFQFPGVKAWRR